MDRNEYEKQSESALADLVTKWTENDVDCKEMNQQITEVLVGLYEKLVPVKVVWFTGELSDQLKKQKQTKKKCRRRSTPRNYAEYYEVLRKTEEMIEEANQQWWEKEVSKLKTASQADKWKINNHITNSDTRMEIQPVTID